MKVHAKRGSQPGMLVRALDRFPMHFERSSLASSQGAQTFGESTIQPEIGEQAALERVEHSLP